MIKATAYLAMAALLGSAAVLAEDAPYGQAQFGAYPDIDSVKQLKTVWDFNFVDPKSVGGVFNNVGALMKAASEFGPHEEEPVKIVVVSHGPEIVVFARKNYAKYKDIVDRAASMASQGVRFEICRNAAAAQGFAPEDLYGFTHVVPAGPYALAYWQAKGYVLNAVGATMPTPPVSDLSRADIKRQGEPAPSGNVSLYTPAGSRQCQGGGKSPDEVRRNLEQRGVRILEASCGHDGRMYASMCGGADGRIVIVEVAARDVTAARGAGLAPLTELPDAAKRSCR